MIIGNNNFNSNNNNFKNKMDAIKNNSLNLEHSNINNTNKYKDINNQNEMIDRSLEILQDRLNKGLISHDEFQKQCAKLGKLRK